MLKKNLKKKKKTNNLKTYLQQDCLLISNRAGAAHNCHRTN